MVKDKVKLF